MAENKDLLVLWEYAKKLENKCELLENENKLLKRENKALARESEEKCEKLEHLNRAIDKACYELGVLDNNLLDDKAWKDWCLSDE